MNLPCHGKQAIEKLKAKPFGLALLDITLPDSNGYELYQILKKWQDIPVIFLTALDEEKNIVKGLELGADDYITKPFHARELLLRIKNVLRHVKIPNQEELLHLQNITINLDRAKVFRNEEEIEMTALEYKILVLLGENQGRIISRGQILANIWDDNENYVNDNTLTVYIKRIREKIEQDPNHPKIIQTVRGLGYKIEQGKG